MTLFARPTTWGPCPVWIRGDDVYHDVWGLVPTTTAQRAVIRVMIAHRPHPVKGSTLRRLACSDGDGVLRRMVQESPYWHDIFDLAQIQGRGHSFKRTFGVAHRDEETEYFFKR